MKAAHLTRKAISRIPVERDEILRRRWAIELCSMTAEQLIFVDESAANERTMDRRMGWSPRGFPCRVQMPGKRSVRWSILPAISIDGYISWEIYQGSIDQERFNSFISKLLLIMSPWPGPRSVLVMDNHSTHHSEAIREMCIERGVILLYLPPYSPDLNPIEQSFAQLKAWIKRNRDLAACYGEDYEGFLHCAMQEVFRGKTAKGHFRRCYIGMPLDDEGSDNDES